MLKSRKHTNTLRLSVLLLLTIFIISGCLAKNKVTPSTSTEDGANPTAGTSGGTESQGDTSTESTNESTEKRGFAAFKAKDPRIIGGKIKTLLRFESDLNGDGTADTIGQFYEGIASTSADYLIINNRRLNVGDTYDTAFVVPIKNSDSQLLAFCNDYARMILIRYDGAEFSTYTEKDIMELLPEIRSSCNDDNTITFEIPDLNILQ